MPRRSRTLQKLHDGETRNEESLPHDRSRDVVIHSCDYISHEPVEQIFSGLGPRYLESEVYRILLESAAAEHAARMTAMDAATRNAAELIEKVTLEIDKIRQAGDYQGIDRNYGSAASSKFVTRQAEKEERN